MMQRQEIETGRKIIEAIDTILENDKEKIKDSAP